MSTVPAITAGTASTCTAAATEPSPVGAGMHKTVAVEGGSWETTYEGKFEFSGGTGKFAKIQGGSIYKGKITPQGLIEQETCTAEY